MTPTVTTARTETARTTPTAPSTAMPPMMPAATLLAPTIAPVMPLLITQMNAPAVMLVLIVKMVVVLRRSLATVPAVMVVSKTAVGVSDGTVAPRGTSPSPRMGRLAARLQPRTTVHQRKENDDDWRHELPVPGNQCAMGAMAFEMGP
jgi:hypothetical protein